MVNSATQITATAPAYGAGLVQVQVTATGGSTSDTAADDYTYVAAASETFVSWALTSNDYADQDPQVSGDRVVWVGSGGADDQILTRTVGADAAPLAPARARPLCNRGRLRPARTSLIRCLPRPHL